jgi:hypothetical protein
MITKLQKVSRMDRKKCDVDKLSNDPGNQDFGLYSLQNFRVGRFGTAPELYPICPYGFKDDFV